MAVAIAIEVRSVVLLRRECVCACVLVAVRVALPLCVEARRLPTLLMALWLSSW